MKKNQLYFVSVANKRSLRKNKADFLIYVIQNRKFCIFYNMITVSKGLSPPVLAQEWFYGLMTRPDMSIKVERQLHDMRILGRIVGVRSTEQFVRHLLTPTSYYDYSMNAEYAFPRFECIEH